MEMIFRDIPVGSHFEFDNTRSNIQLPSGRWQKDSHTQATAVETTVNSTITTINPISPVKKVIEHPHDKTQIGTRF